MSQHEPVDGIAFPTAIGTMEESGRMHLESVDLGLAHRAWTAMNPPATRKGNRLAHEAHEVNHGHRESFAHCHAASIQNSL